MNVLEKILEEIKEVEKKFVVGHEVLFALGATGMTVEIEKIIRSHMDEREVFKFDFNRVKSFDCQCGRHYVNTYDGGWIPVDERLPEEGEKILYDMQLVTLEDGEVCLGVYRNQENEWWTRRQQGEEWYTNKHDVVAWKPLPEPYIKNPK